MNNTIYIIWDVKYCPCKIYEVKLSSLTSNECYLLLSIHSKRLHDTITEFEKETILKFQKDICLYSKYIESDKNFDDIISNKNKLGSLLIFTGE